MTPWIATEADIPVLVEIGRKFHAMSPHKPVGPFDAEAVGRVLVMLIAHPDGLVMTNGVGAIGGMIAPVYFSPGVKMMEEHFWFSDIGGGRDLLRAFENVSRETGADYVMLSTLENDKSQVIDRVVSRMGFIPIERRYMKDLRP